MGINATITDFFKTESLDLLNSSSKDPSRTITIKPIVPKIGSSPLRLGTLILKTSVNCCNPHPERSKRITDGIRSEEHTSELQSRPHLVCRLLLEKKKKNKK